MTGSAETQPPPGAAAGGWRVLTTSTIGASHAAVGLPNQDAVESRQISAEAVVAAVADGHGHQRHFRSATGSALAVRIGCQAAAELADRLDGLDSARQIEDETRSVLVAAIISRWRAAVLEHLAAEPFTAAEEAARAAGDSDLIAYGATLLLGLAWRRWLVLAQIGDGDMVGVQPDGRPLLPMPKDPALDGQQTTSLCGSRPERDFRVAAVDTARKPLLALLMATDGYGNAQVADPWPDAVSADLAEMIGDRELEWFGQQLPTWAARCASADGSGDDTTVALLIAPDAAQARRRAKLATPAVSRTRRLARSLPVTRSGSGGPDSGAADTELSSGARRRTVLIAAGAALIAAGVVIVAVVLLSSSGSSPGSPTACDSASQHSGLTGLPAGQCRSAPDSPSSRSPGSPSPSANSPSGTAS